MLQDRSIRLNSLLSPKNREVSLHAMCWEQLFGQWEHSQGIAGKVLVNRSQKLPRTVLAIKQCGQCSILCLALFHVV